MDLNTITMEKPADPEAEAEAEPTTAADEWLASTIRCMAVLVAQGCEDAVLVRAWRAYQAVGHVARGRN